MMYKVMSHYEDGNGWNDEEIFSSNSLEECIGIAKENGGWYSEESYVDVMNEDNEVVWE